jgi:hypothetical protein
VAAPEALAAGLEPVVEPVVEALKQKLSQKERSEIKENGIKKIPRAAGGFFLCLNDQKEPP